MVKKNKIKRRTDSFDINLLNCRLLGKGHNGIVFLLPDDKVIKICYSAKSFKGEYEILKKVDGSKYFPRIYEIGGNYMIRDCIHGECLKHYIKKNGMNKELALNIINMLKDFKKIGFKKIDLRCKDIYVQKNKTLKVIDPKKFYSKSRNFPKHLSKGLYKLGVLDYFLKIVKEEDIKLYKVWNPSIQSYISENYKDDIQI